MLSTDPDGSTIALDGRVLARVFPAAESGTASKGDAGPWTEAKNQRRCDLVDKKIDVGLTPEETSELASLEQLMDHHLRSVAPLPLDEVRRLHDQLLADAVRRQ